MKNVLGISIDTEAIRICEVTKGEMDDFITIDIPENSVVNGAVVSWTALSEILKNARKEKHFHTKNCALVLPDGGTYVRKLDMPAMSSRQLLVNLPYEFHDVLPDDPEHYLFDYSMIDVRKGADGKAVGMDLVGATVSKNLIQQYTDLFERAGLQLIKATPRVIALEDLLRKAGGEYIEKDFALLDLGMVYTRVDIYHNGIYEVTRSIDHGLNDVISAAAEVLGCDVHIAKEYLADNKDNIQSNQSVSAVYDSIATEVMRALNYYTYENRDNTLDKLYYCGEGAYLEPYRKSVESSISLPLEALSEMNEDDEEALMESPAALGAALGD